VWCEWTRHRRVLRELTAEFRCVDIAYHQGPRVVCRASSSPWSRRSTTHPNRRKHRCRHRHAVGKTAPSAAVDSRVRKASENAMLAASAKRSALYRLAINEVSSLLKCTTVQTSEFGIRSSVRPLSKDRRPNFLMGYLVGYAVLDRSRNSSLPPSR
jgi:hypothetical protein